MDSLIVAAVIAVFGMATTTHSPTAKAQNFVTGIQTMEQQQREFYRQQELNYQIQQEVQRQLQQQEQQREFNNSSIFRKQ